MRRQHPPTHTPHNDLRSTLAMMLSGNQFAMTDHLAGATKAVLVIHASQAPRTATPLENRLARDGFQVFRFCLGPAPIVGIEETARIMGMRLKEITRANSLGRFAIVGHSFGGIIARAFISLRRGDRLCHTLITLGSPHQGHPHWHWGSLKWLTWFTPLRRDLKPDSALMKKLRLNPLPAQVRCVSVSSNLDRICPPAMCKLDLAEGTTHLVNETINDISHFDFMVDNHTYHAVHDHLREGFRNATTA